MPRLGKHAVRKPGRPPRANDPAAQERQAARRIFGRWLQAEMIRRDMSAASMGRAVGVSKQAVTRWLRGEACPEGERRGKVAEALQIPEIDMP